MPGGPNAEPETFPANTQLYFHKVLRLPVFSEILYLRFDAVSHTQGDGK